MLIVIILKFFTFIQMVKLQKCSSFAFVKYLNIIVHEDGHDGPHCLKDK